MSYENSAGLGVHNHYGPRETGGGQGVFKTEGYLYEYVIDFDGERLNFDFVNYPDGIWVYEVDTKFAVGTLGTLTIGGTNIKAAVPATPVKVTPTSNARDDLLQPIVATGLTGGKLTIRFKNVA